ncbi:MAG: Gfo/Idh/MocA family oxidoreductase [Phycisphaeraceae bacterium]
MSDRKRYAIVGASARSSMYSKALFDTHKEHGELVAYCDINQVRMDYHNRKNVDEFGGKAVPTYRTDQFDQMIREQKVDAVIVTSIDRTHHRYIIRAMELGCDAVTEKPMTVDAEKCQQILDTVERTGRNLTVTFNYRYAPRNSKIKELIMDGAIGEVISVHFEWLLDTKHGADYFRRWHRDKRNSGGLMVHKATHHFDLVNWWLASAPQEVYASGDLFFYGRENAEKRGETKFYSRALEHPHAKDDPFALDLTKNKEHRELYVAAEVEDGYCRDQSVFGDGISIEDDMSVLVKYQNKARMTYHLTAYSPWEGYRVMFNGTRGRLEYEVTESAYVSGADDDHNLARNVGGSAGYEVEEPVSILLRPMWGKIIQVEVPQTNEGGHGGGDIRLLNDVFIGGGDDPLGRAAGHVDGAKSILTGIAANRSMATGLPVNVDTLVRLPEANCCGGQSVGVEGNGQCCWESAGM